MGSAMGVVAAPCVGPFVVTLLAYVADLGARMPRPEAAALGASLFFVLSLGLGLPFFLVGMGIASIRPGEWMVTVKKLFGFVILGMALWFLRPMLLRAPFPLFETLLLALLVATAVYFLRPGASLGERFQRLAFRTVGALAGVGAAGVALVLFGVVSMPGEAALERPFEPYSAARLEAARQASKPVVIDFSAEWCTVCKEIEHRVFPHPTVQERFEDFALLRADLTDNDDPAVQALRKDYHIAGLPCIVFLDSEGREVPELRLTGYEGPEKFVDRLDCAAEVDAARNG
jgi:thiol:disulfide interchange protein DsbD